MNMRMILEKMVKTLLVISLAACSVMTMAAQDASLNNVYSEDKQNISVALDKPTFVLKLKSNPTTGYAWFLRDYNTNLIIPVKHSFQPPERGLIGAPGYELWTFRVKPAAFTVPQITTIRMTYARPWQSGDSSTQIVFHVSTQGK